MDNHKGLSASARMEGFENMYYYGRRPTSIYIPRFKNVHEKETRFIRGYNLAGSAYRNRPKQSNGIGTALKVAMTEAGGWQVGLTGYGECLMRITGLL